MPAPDLRNIRDFSSLIRYLEDELGWPLEGYEMEDITFDYEPSDLGLKDEDAAKVKTIRQLRPLTTDQPWGIFFIEFDKKKLPVVLLRRILSHLVVKKRASANRADRAAWSAEDLLFVSAFGPEDSDGREIGFAHFHQESGDLPSLRVLGWDGADTSLKLQTVASTLRERLHWPEKGEKVDAWRERWAKAFRHRIGHIIRTSDLLAEAMAALAKRIRDAATTIMEHETESGPLRKLHHAFQTHLIHDLTEEGFADTYAQTITYGLLTAAISRTEMSEGRRGTALIASNISDMVPVTNPFLKEMLETFLNVGGRKGGMDFDELGIQDVVELLRGEETDLPAILRDFGNKTAGEDPVIHFYEHFLNAYNKKLKVQRGVFYTPQPVVGYIVRSVHELLQTEFGLEDGLADTTTWGEMVERNPDLKLPTTFDDKNEEVPISSDEPFVQILDPATGTATFLVEVIDVIHKHLAAKWNAAGAAAMPSIRNSKSEIRNFPEYWNLYVPHSLLPRLHAFELMMAPYAIAHMKIGLKLAETGYRFGTEERARVYLTNALEPWVKQLPLIGFEALAHEAAAVNEIKRHKRFTVVIGNPPYSHMTANPSEALRGIVDIYRQLDGEVIREKGAIMFERTIQDDYVKFHALADRLTAGRPAIRAYITNSAYLDNPTLRGMRCHLTHAWEATWLLDLHGDVKRAGDGDENVFDIRTGVAIAVFLRTPDIASSARSVFGELAGQRTDKYRFLSTRSLHSTDWSPLTPQTPYYRFRPQSGEGVPELQDAPLIHDVFVLKSEAIKTNRDHFVIGDSDDEILRRIRSFIEPAKTTAAVKEELSLNDNAQWTVEGGRKDCRGTFNTSHLAAIAYRPFDDKRIYYHPSVVFNPRPVLADNVLGRENVVFVTSRRIRTHTHAHFFVTDKIVVKEMLSSADNCNGYPLYRFDKHFGKEQRLTNFTPDFLKTLTTRLGLRQTGEHGLPAGLTPEDIFHYAYAVFHSPGYRSRYSEFLKIDFPRLPLTGNLELFRALARLGGELTALHLMEFNVAGVSVPESDGNFNLSAKAETTFIGTSREVTKVGYSDHTVWINAGGTKNSSRPGTAGFHGVPEAVWNFHIGGYQVCEKWLKDRKGRTLNDDDIAHYHKIVVALSETIRLMAEIDEVIEQHGGWPGAFASASVVSSSDESASAAASNDPTPTRTKDAAWQEGELPLG